MNDVIVSNGWTLPHRLLWRLRRFRFMVITIRALVELLTFASLRKPPTFTRLDSATHLRWWFPLNPSRALRAPERHQGTRTLPPALQINLMQPLGRQLRRICLGTPIGVVRCLVDSGHNPRLCRVLRDRGVISRRLTPTSLGLTIVCLSLARRLGGLHRASSVPLSGRLALTRQEPP